MKGKVFIFEGCDNVGKTTQARLLVENLKHHNYPVQHFQFPNRSTPIGITIDTYLRDIFNKNRLNAQAIHLLFTLNRFEALTEMQKLVDAGVNLVIDRYIHSGIAYSCAKGLDMDWCCGVEKGLLEPDIVLYLDAKEPHNRSGFGGEAHDTIEFQKQVKHFYDVLSTSSGGTCRWVTFDGDKPRNILAESIFICVDGILNIK